MTPASASEHAERVVVALETLCPCRSRTLHGRQRKKTGLLLTFVESPRKNIFNVPLRPARGKVQYYGNIARYPLQKLSVSMTSTSRLGMFVLLSCPL